MRISGIFGVAAVLFAAVALSACGGREPAEPTEQGIGERFFVEAKAVDKLVLARMTISKMASIDDLSLSEARGPEQVLDALLDAVKIGDRKAAYSYDTYLQAFVDMSALRPEDVSVDEKSRLVSIHLPKVQTEFAGRDAAVREEHYRVTGLRSQIKPAERARLKELMNEALRQEVESNPEFRRRLTETARAKASEYFKALGKTEGYDVQVSFDS